VAAAVVVVAAAAAEARYRGRALLTLLLLPANAMLSPPVDASEDCLLSEEREE